MPVRFMAIPPPHKKERTLWPHRQRSRKIFGVHFTFHFSHNIRYYHCYHCTPPHLTTTMKLLVALAAFVAPASAEVYFKEQFNDDVSFSRKATAPAAPPTTG